MANCYEVTRKWTLIAKNQADALKLAKPGLHEEVTVKRIRLKKQPCESLIYLDDYTNNQPPQKKRRATK